MPGQPKPNKSGPQRVCDSCYKNITLDKKMTEAMQAHGLTTEEQAQLIAEGVTTVEIFNKIPDDAFGRSGIDIAARREAKRDQADGQAKAAGAVLCVEGAGTAERNGYYREAGAPASLPLADDDIMMIS